MVVVVKRFLSSGLPIAETAIRMDVPVDYVVHKGTLLFLIPHRYRKVTK